MRVLETHLLFVNKVSVIKTEFYRCDTKQQNFTSRIYFQFEKYFNAEWERETKKNIGLRISLELATSCSSSTSTNKKEHIIEVLRSRLTQCSYTEFAHRATVYNLVEKCIYFAEHFLKFQFGCATWFFAYILIFQRMSARGIHIISLLPVRSRIY